MTELIKSMCSIDGCNNKPHGYGYCNKHYKRWKRYGDPLHENTWKSPPVCKVTGCDSEAWARELCSSHYSKWRSENVRLDPNRVKKPRFTDPEESFNTRTEWQGQCLVWTGYAQHDGYGQMRINGKGKRVHRYAWERVNGQVPDGFVIDHVCHNPACVNIDHLRLASRSQNGAYRKGPEEGSQTGIRNVYQVGNGFVVIISKGETRFRSPVLPDIEQAEQLAEATRKKMFGQFAGKG